MTHEELYQKRLSEFTWAAMTYQDIAERAVALEELVLDLYEFAYDEYPDSAELNFASRMAELGVEP